MNKSELISRSEDSNKPLVIEFWAPWCMPCKVMAPALEKVSQQYKDSINLIRVNADDDAQLVKEFHIMGIPSIIIFSDGREISRHTGLLNFSQLESLFGALANHQEILIAPSTPQRILRIMSGSAIAIIGNLWGPALPLYLLGAVIVFSGVYDRCPIFKMMYPKVKSWFIRKPAKVIE
jgi:thioredoxin 1